MVIFFSFFIVTVLVILFAMFSNEVIDFVQEYRNKSDHQVARKWRIGIGTCYEYHIECTCGWKGSSTSRLTAWEYFARHRNHERKMTKMKEGVVEGW